MELDGATQTCVPVRKGHTWQWKNVFGAGNSAKTQCGPKVCVPKALRQGW
jgi:hypothetical protein